MINVDSECSSSVVRFELWRSPRLGCRDYVLLNYRNDFGLILINMVKIHNANKQFTFSVISLLLKLHYTV